MFVCSTLFNADAECLSDDVIDSNSIAFHFHFRRLRFLAVLYRRIVRPRLVHDSSHADVDSRRDILVAVLESFLELRVLLALDDELEFFCIVLKWDDSIVIIYAYQFQLTDYSLALT